MKRLVAMGVLVAGVLAAVLASTGAGGEPGAQTYRVDALFRNAGFLISGQDVKIAGAKVGSVKAVRLTPDRRARIEMEVDERFAPFRSDATCTIQPQSLIGEKFLQCTPGTPDGRPLTADGDQAPTVPLAQTRSPVDLDLVLAALRQPTTMRASLLVSALGGGLTGRADDLSAAIRDADPALREVQALLGQVNGERRTIQQLIRESDTVLQTLAGRREDVADVVASARRLTDTTAARRRELQQTVRGLPALLDEARPALAELRALAEDGTPVVSALRAATPDAERLVARLAPFARDARPTVEALGQAAVTGSAALQEAAPQLRRVRRLGEALRPASAETRALFESLRDQGAVEGLLRFVYFATSALSRFDSVSHILPAYVLAADTCSLYATTTVAACDAHFADGRVRAAGGRRAKQAPARTPAAEVPDAPKPAPAPSPPAPSTTPAPAPTVPRDPAAPLRELPQTVQELPEQLRDALDGVLDPKKPLLDFLLGGG